MTHKKSTQALLRTAPMDKQLAYAPSLNSPQEQFAYAVCISSAAYGSPHKQSAYGNKQPTLLKRSASARAARKLFLDSKF